MRGSTEIDCFDNVVERGLPVLVDWDPIWHFQRSITPGGMSWEYRKECRRRCSILLSLIFRQRKKLLEDSLW
jgi:hypothetical protein